MFEKKESINGWDLKFVKGGSSGLFSRTVPVGCSRKERLIKDDLKTIVDSMSHIIDCYDEIDRLGALQPEENPKIQVRNRALFLELPCGVYKVTNSGLESVVILYDNKPEKLVWDVTYGLDVTESLSHVTEYQLLYEFPEEEKKKFKVHGHIVIDVDDTVEATSQKEAQAIYDARPRVGSGTYHKGMYMDDSDPFAD